MGRYVLRDDLSFCKVGGRLVFLDIGSDHYLRLPQELETALVQYLEANGPVDVNVSELVNRNILVEGAAPQLADRSKAPIATRSAMEASYPAPRVTASQALEIIGLVVDTQRRLKLHPFREALAVLPLCHPNPPADTKSPQSSTEQRIIEAAATFRRVRPYVPIRMRCLVDSLSMTRFLRRRGLHVRVVFGVAVDPFSAHCWVQAGDLLLNDTLGNATSHTPIRVL